MPASPAMAEHDDGDGDDRKGGVPAVVQPDKVGPLLWLNESRKWVKVNIVRCAHPSMKQCARAFMRGWLGGRLRGVGWYQWGRVRPGR